MLCYLLQVPSPAVPAPLSNGSDKGRRGDHLKGSPFSSIYIKIIEDNKLKDYSLSICYLPVGRSAEFLKVGFTSQGAYGLLSRCSYQYSIVRIQIYHPQI